MLGFGAATRIYPAPCATDSQTDMLDELQMCRQRLTAGMLATLLVL